MTFEPYWVSIFVTPIVMRWMLLSAETARAKHKAGAIIFPASPLALLCLMSVLFACGLVIGCWREGDGALILGIGLAWVVFFLWLWPSTIILDDKGLTAKHVWRPTRTIPYSEIEYVSRMANRRAIVYGRGKVKEITISEYHVGDDELEAELRKRGVKYYTPTPFPLKS